MTAAFDAAFIVVVGEEGGLDTDPADSGNWTGGAIGAGTLAGTKYGISAASYPATDIAGLTLADAQAIYQRDYWTPIAGDALPPGLALLVFDAAVNNGLGRAARWLQRAVGAMDDGQIGPDTMSCVRASIGHDPHAAMIEFMALRIDFMGGLIAWHNEGLGWSRRLAALPYLAEKIT